MDELIIKIANLFDIDGTIVSYGPIGNGHINSTLLCKADNGKKYVLQKINNIVFKDVDLLMSNYYKISQFLFENGFESIHIRKTKDDRTYCCCGDSMYRMYDYIDNTIWYEEIDNLDAVYKAAQAFGKLHKALKGFDAKELGEVIPNFHNTYQRYLNLLDAIENDKLGRVKSCLPEIELAKSFEKEYGKVVFSIKSKEIPLAVTHNDPKINNVLFDKNTGNFRAVIDLDTIMPGSYLYDFGDALRSLFTGDNEDSEDLSKLVVNYDIFETYSDGYLSEMKDVLTKKEIELLPFSSFLLTVECGMRFLEDYLRGDVYFKTSKQNHNLIRARTQLTLASRIYNKLDELNKIIKRLLEAWYGP